MNLNRSFVLPFVSITVLTFVVAACSKQAEASKTGAAVVANPVQGPLPTIAAAPSWTLKDVNGAAVRSDQFKGKVVVVDFWATWCPPCRAEIPGYVDLVKKHGKDGLVIVGVSMDEAGPSVVKEFNEKFGVNYSIVMGDDAVVAAFGGIEALPTTFLIDRNGQIRDRKVGAEPTEDYERKIVALLK
jgi:thiol-disulfide isomerase/thioredoxin